MRWLAFSTFFLSWRGFYAAAKSTPDKEHKYRVKGQSASNEKEKSWTTVFRSITVWLLVITTSSLVILNFFFYEASLRAVAAYAQARTGIALDFTQAEGNIFTGELRAQGVKTGNARVSAPRKFFINRLEVEAVDLTIARGNTLQ